MQRIIKTLRKTHTDYYLSITVLLDAVYRYNHHDHEQVIDALRQGTLGGKEHTDREIINMKNTKVFRKRYGKYLRKEIRPPNVMREKLEEWYQCFKCSAGDECKACGRVDPLEQEFLFTRETKSAIQNCKQKAQFLQDPLPLEQMYDVIKPNPNSKHGLNEYLSRRGESNLEAFHLLLAHFGNSGMRRSLADTLNLTSTARYNHDIH